MKAQDEDFQRWLESLGMEKYAERFADNDVGFEALRVLSDMDLKELGLSLGHRRILQDALKKKHLQGASPAPTAARSVVGQGERRQITVMFCDLVGSSELSAKFDPEDLRNLIHDYYSSCCKIIEESGGFIARIVGDGILAYFGYPTASEDAAECAIRAGLTIVESMGCEPVAGRRRINVRIGLATGVSIISDMIGIGFSELHAVVGQTPNIASRIQSLVAPGMVAVADETRRLAGGFFVYADHGMHDIKGFERPMQIWRVVGKSGSGARFDAHHSAHVDCIGRDAQLSALQTTWEQVQRGNCRVVTLMGEPGIGKSRLQRTASERFRPRPGMTVLLQCSPSLASAPLHPVIEWLRRDIGVSPSGASDARGRIEAWLGEKSTPLETSLLAELLSVSLTGDAEPSIPPDRKRHLTREVVLHHFERHCKVAPLLLMVEDAHWMDSASEEFLTALFARMNERPMMALITVRPGNSRHWDKGTNASGMTLPPLPRVDAKKLIQNACRGRRLPSTVMEQILTNTDGVPLFIEELTAMVLESTSMREEANVLAPDGALPSLDIPSTLRDSLMARLDRLSDIKDIARIASALGREFSFSLLAQVSEVPTHQLTAALDRLVEAQLLFQRGVPPNAEYVFKHALVQQAAYDIQLRGDRHALHARIVSAIETHQPDIASHEPGLMAHHCELAGMSDREVDYLYQAGLASTRMVAIPEALAYFKRADAALTRLEASPRNAARNIEVILGMMDVGRFAILPSRLRALSERAHALSLMDGVTCDMSMTAAILFQEGRAKVYSSRYAEAREIFQELRRLGNTYQSTTVERKPASAFGMSLCCQGLFNETLEFINEGNIGHYKEAGSFIDYISGLGWIAYASCQTGSIDDGLRLGHLSVHEAQLVQSKIYLAGAHIWRSHAFMALRLFDEAVADAKQCVMLSEAHGVPYLGWHGLVFLALCQCRSGKVDEAADSLERARLLLAQVEDRQWSLLDYLPAIEAEIACFRGEHARAIESADDAIAVAGAIGGHFAEAAAWRVKAISSIRAGGDPDQAQVFLDRAMHWYERGDAKAECAFSSWVWAHSLQRAGYPERARRWENAARALADRHGFDLDRCEYWGQ